MICQLNATPVAINMLRPLLAAYYPKIKAGAPFPGSDARDVQQHAQYYVTVLCAWQHAANDLSLLWMCMCAQCLC